MNEKQLSKRKQEYDAWIERYKAKRKPFATIICPSCNKPHDTHLPDRKYGAWGGCATCPNCGELFLHRSTPDKITVIPMVNMEPDEKRCRTFVRGKYPPRPITPRVGLFAASTPMSSGSLKIHLPTIKDGNKRYIMGGRCGVERHTDAKDVARVWIEKINAGARTIEDFKKGEGL